MEAAAHLEKIDDDEYQDEIGRDEEEEKSGIRNDNDSHCSADGTDILPFMEEQRKNQRKSRNPANMKFADAGEQQQQCSKHHHRTEGGIDEFSEDEKVQKGVAMRQIPTYARSHEEEHHLPGHELGNNSGGNIHGFYFSMMMH